MGNPRYCVIMVVLLLLAYWWLPSQEAYAMEMHFQLEEPVLENDTIHIIEPLEELTDTIPVKPAPLWMGEHNLSADSDFVAVQRITDNTGIFITVWILFSLLLIGLIKFIFPLRFREVVMAAWEARFFNQIEREGGIFTNWVSFFLFFNFLLGLALLFYQTIGYFDLTPMMPATHPMVLMFYALVIFAAWYFLKFIIMVFGGWIFRVGRPTESVLRITLIINQFAGLALLPFLIVNYYNPAPGFLIAAWAILGVAALYKIIRLSSIGLRMTGFSTLHLILYLCTIEIAPLLFIIKYSERFV
jgi:hypothetical protein